MSFINFWNRNLSFFWLAIKAQLEYRINFLTDVLLQPIVTAIIEMLLWQAVFASINQPTLAGFNKSSYLAYALWAAFVARISSNWMYEFRMIEEIESGSINALLTKPFHFYEYYLFQFLGYKGLTTLVSLGIPIGVSFYFDLDLQLNRLPLALLMVSLYLIFLFNLSFLVSMAAFHFTRVSSITVAKNLALWLLSGELLPLDIFPSQVSKVLIYLPFSKGVFTPVGFITGRIDLPQMLTGFISLGVGIIVTSFLAQKVWQISQKTYVGTAA